MAFFSILIFLFFQKIICFSVFVALSPELKETLKSTMRLSETTNHQLALPTAQIVTGNTSKMYPLVERQLQR